MFLCKIDHIVARGRGGSDRISNLTLACAACNRAKNNRDVAEFVTDPARLERLVAHAQAPLRDAAAINATRWALLGVLKTRGLPVELGGGGPFQTGDMVRAHLPAGKRQGLSVGRVLCRASWSFDIVTHAGRIAGIPRRHCRPIHRKDGYGYA
jgi:hypothetical protein